VPRRRLPQPAPQRPVLAALAPRGRHGGPPSRRARARRRRVRATGLVVVGGRDILHDRAVDYAARLKAMGKPVEVRDFEGQQHGFFTIDPWSDASAELMRVIKRFVDSDGRFD